MKELYFFGIPVLWYSLESSALNAIRSSNQLEKGSKFGRFPVVDDCRDIPDLIPSPGNDDELERNSLSSGCDTTNPHNEGVLLSSARKAYDLRM